MHEGTAWLPTRDLHPARCLQQPQDSTSSSHCGSGGTLPGPATGPHQTLPVTMALLLRVSVCPSQGSHSVSLLLRVSISPSHSSHHTRPTAMGAEGRARVQLLHRDGKAEALSSELLFQNHSPSSLLTPSSLAAPSQGTPAASGLLTLIPDTEFYIKDGSAESSPVLTFQDRKSQLWHEPKGAACAVPHRTGDISSFGANSLMSDGNLAATATDGGRSRVGL